MLPSKQHTTTFAFKSTPSQPPTRCKTSHPPNHRRSSHTTTNHPTTLSIPLLIITLKKQNKTQTQPPHTHTHTHTTTRTRRVYAIASHLSGPRCITECQEGAAPPVDAILSRHLVLAALARTSEVALPSTRVGDEKDVDRRPRRVGICMPRVHEGIAPA